ncbi:MAG: hypothetical protein CSB24_04130 [Deltaproteobacteria bacterium]|nr:MAG: hypothetical protein CSB24_04130 [Deltaproteobacteria bacterium]
MFVSTKKGGGTLLRVYVQPRSSKNKIAGLYDGHIKINLTAPPVNGAANQAAAVFLAKCLNIAKNRVRIHSGLQARKKTFLVQGLSQEEVRSYVLEKIEG